MLAWTATGDKSMNGALLPSRRSRSSLLEYLSRRGLPRTLNGY